ncbi:MAG: DinB family protein [Chitinophagales bacterium]
MIHRKTFIPFGEMADFSIDYIVGILEDARATTLQKVHNISTEELHWQYAKGWNSISVLLSHAIACEHYFRIEFIEGRRLTEKEWEWLKPGMEMGEFIPQLLTNQPIEHYIEELEKSRKLTLDALAKLNTADFHRKIDSYDEETGCNLAWVIYHQAEDEVHHRGQMSILRKLYKEI